MNETRRGHGDDVDPESTRRMSGKPVAGLARIALVLANGFALVIYSSTAFLLFMGAVMGGGTPSGARLVPWLFSVIAVLSVGALAAVAVLWKLLVRARLPKIMQTVVVAVFFVVVVMLLFAPPGFWSEAP